MFIFVTTLYLVIMMLLLFKGLLLSVPWWCDSGCLTLLYVVVVKACQQNLKIFDVDRLVGPIIFDSNNYLQRGLIISPYQPLSLVHSPYKTEYTSLGRLIDENKASNM